jgi:nitrite reductase/ring-hydroxylating ferredoxin subunit
MFERSGVALSDLERLGRKVVRQGGKQVLLIASGGRVFAVANRCPHEGYPLSEGTLGPACVLTCDWHNWKFDLASGETLVGRDPVRAYPVRVEDGEIAFDLAEPPAERQRERALAGLSAAIADDDRTRMAREAARLQRAGFDGRDALAHAIEAVSERLEGGMTHAHAAAADWLALADRAPSADLRLAALLEPIGHLAWDTLGAERFPFAESRLDWDADAFVRAMEAEDEFSAQGFVRGALDDGLAYGDLRPALARAALAHYADFGHSAIYVLKAGQLIDRLGDRVTRPVLQALVRQLVYARREERLPEFRAYGPTLVAWSADRDRPIEAADLTVLSTPAILKRLSASSGRPTAELFDALMGAVAWTLLHFDTRLERAAGRVIADNVSWLDFTHALTFANAAHHLCTEEPALWPAALLQIALFIGRNKPFVEAQQDVTEWAVDDPAALLEREMAALYDHAIPEPIIACHRVKVLFALEDELAQAPGAPWAAAMCAAVN